MVPVDWILYVSDRASSFKTLNGNNLGLVHQEKDFDLITYWWARLRFDYILMENNASVALYFEFSVDLSGKTCSAQQNMPLFTFAFGQNLPSEKMDTIKYPMTCNGLLGCIHVLIKVTRQVSCLPHCISFDSWASSGNSIYHGLPIWTLTTLKWMDEWYWKFAIAFLACSCTFEILDFV